MIDAQVPSYGMHVHSVHHPVPASIPLPQCSKFQLPSYELVLPRKRESRNSKRHSVVKHYQNMIDLWVNMKCRSNFEVGTCDT